jgi:hypothetical protein
MADSLRSPTPVSAAGGFAGRAPGQRQEPRVAIAASPSDGERAADRVDVGGSAAVARRVLRERVLARTRRWLELDDGVHTQEFAEAIEAEPVGAFVGRLLSAQNQLGAHRLAAWGAIRVRAALDHGLREGAAEALDVLTADARDAAGAAAVVADVLAEYGRRLATLADEAAGHAAPGAPRDEPPSDRHDRAGP